MVLGRVSVLTAVMTHAFISYLSRGSSSRLLVRALVPNHHVHKSRHALTAVLVRSGTRSRPFLSAARTFSSSLGSTVEKVEEDLDAALNDILSERFSEGEEEHMEGSHPMPAELVEKVRYC